MAATLLLPPPLWAQLTFGSAALGDRRRTRRLVSLAAAMVRRPDASLPAQLRSLAALKAAYRLLNQPDVTPEALLAPHLLQTRHAAAGHPVVLLLQDTTEVDYSAHPKSRGLGPIGDGRGRGFLLQTVLALLPSSRQVLGLLSHETWRRPETPLGSRRQSSWQRKQRERESAVWLRAVATVGPPPPGCRWVHVGDRGSDLFDVLTACHSTGADFLVRAAQDRCVTSPEGEASHLLSFARSLPGVASRSLCLPARHGRPAREAQLSLAYSAVTVHPPARSSRGQEAIAGWVVRVWEREAPAGQEAIEWVLVTSVETGTPEAAWERIDWYTCRWRIEEYHQCLKSGCALEQRQCQEYGALTRLLAVLAPMAVRLLQGRENARQEPERRAQEVMSAAEVAVVAELAQVPAGELTLGRFWHEVARQGGYLGRRRDGPPGWRTLWRGWLHIQTLLEGVHLAAHLTGHEPG
jgi:hypothetical protein